MAWTCYSCGTKNPNSADQCQSCGGTVAAPRSFYVHWIFGGAVFFFVTYLAGTLAGGTLVEFAVSPSDAAVLARVNADLEKGMDPYDNIDTVEAEKKAAARAAVVTKARDALNPIINASLYWVLPALLFIICGIIVGFVSDGKTVLEAGFGSIVGQAGGFLLHHFVFGTGLPWLVLAIGIVPGFGLGVLGAWLGEIIQDRKEQAC
ncbi:MAG: hypothetical protein R6V85_08110 [Polyangia bacterium]